MPRPTVAPPAVSSHDLPVSPALAQLMRTGWDQGEAPAEPVQVAEWAAKRRDRLSELFPGERLVVPAGAFVPRSNDCDYRFRPNTAYVWLTGDQSAAGVLVLEPAAGGHHQTLFIKPNYGYETDDFWLDRRFGQLWSGPRHTLVQARAALGIECRHIDELSGALAGGTATRTLRGVDPGVDNLVAEPAAPYADAEFAAALSELRLHKDSYEVAELTTAVDATVQGFTDCVADWSNALRHGERWIEGTFWRRARVDGNDVGYNTIVAAGAHASTLHWIDNDGPLPAGQLVLLDMGVEARSLYTADITRTLPVSGTFTPQQRELYELVYRAQQAGMDAVRPGARFRDFHNAAVHVMAHGLADLGLLPCSAEQALDEQSQIYRRWTLCNSGHMLGLDVHDCARARPEHYLDGVLEAGHVLTVEPGLYLQHNDLLLPEELRGIGIRIEDDLLVTDDGYTNLSAGLPRTAGQIEQWMGELLA